MGRKNHRARPTRARWYESRSNGQSGHASPPPIERMVIPKGRCNFPHRKLQFTKAEALKALEQAQQYRDFKGSEHREERAYECEKSDGGCGMWHLTSRTTWEKR